MTATSQTAPLLEIRGLTVRFGGLLAVSDLNLQVEQGQIFALVGPNGAGKTTVLNCISGFIKPTSGSILFCGMPLLPLGRHHRAQLGIGRTFQHLQLFSTMTVLENLLLAQHTQLKTGWGFLPVGPGRTVSRRARERAFEALALFELEDVANVVVSMLPHGIQKQVSVARALALQPKLVLLDEPAAGLPHQEVETLAQHMRRWCVELGTTLVLIEHNMRLVQAVSDHVCVLDYGRKLAEGAVKTVLTDPAVLAAYLGREALATGESLLQSPDGPIEQDDGMSLPDREEGTSC